MENLFSERILRICPDIMDKFNDLTVWQTQSHLNVLFIAAIAQHVRDDRTSGLFLAELQAALLAELQAALLAELQAALLAKLFAKLQIDLFDIFNKIVHLFILLIGILFTKRILRICPDIMDKFNYLTVWQTQSHLDVLFITAIA